MIIGSLYNEFIRHYIRYLLDEVTVIPLEDMDIKLLSTSVRLIVNEESKIPRWLAYILAKHNKVKIKEEEDPRELIGRLTYYSFRERESSPLSSIEKNLYFKIREYVQSVNDQTRKKIIDALENFVRIRLPKIVRRALTTGYDKDVLLWEDILAKYIRKLSNKWVEVLIKQDFDISRYV